MSGSVTEATVHNNQNVRFVAPAGIDSNEQDRGLSWNKPYKTILKAYDSLPQEESLDDFFFFFLFK
jgi:hypothetical protein